jgi:bacteriocin biosynthesis cyclodehydratase domain-containing protein
MSDSEEPWTAAIRFGAAFGIVVLSPDDVEFRTGTTSGRSFVVSDSERRGILGTVIERMLSTQLTPARPWNGAETELLNELMPQLTDSGIVESDVAAAAAAADREAAVSLLRVPMAEAHIGIVGHGVLGKAVRGLLRGMSFGRLSLIESGSVASHDNAAADDEPSRQDATSETPIPRPTHDQEWLDILRGFDWIVAAQDCFEPEELAALNKAALQLRLPWSLVCFDGYEGWVGPTFVPGQTACFGCFRRRLFASAAEPKHIFSDPGVKVHRLPSPAAIGPETTPWVSLIASMLAMDIVAAMRGFGFTLNHMLTVHRFNLTFQREAVLRLPRCEDCSVRRSAPQLNYFANVLPTRTAAAEPHD